MDNPSPHPPSQPGQAGFSVLELVVVLALMATFVGLISPSLAQPLDRQSQRASMHQLHSHLNRARFLAISQQTWVTACPSASGRRCDRTTRWHDGWLVFIDRHKSGQPDDPDAVIAIGEALTTGVITSGARQRIRFDPQGHAYGSNGTIEQCPSKAPGPIQKIVVSNPGRVRFVEPDQLAVCHRL